MDCCQSCVSRAITAHSPHGRNALRGQVETDPVVRDGEKVPVLEGRLYHPAAGNHHRRLLREVQDDEIATARPNPGLPISGPGQDHVTSLGRADGDGKTVQSEFAARLGSPRDDQAGQCRRRAGSGRRRRGGQRRRRTGSDRLKGGQRHRIRSDRLAGGQRRRRIGSCRLGDSQRRRRFGSCRGRGGFITAIRALCSLRTVMGPG